MALFKSNKRKAFHRLPWYMALIQCKPYGAYYALHSTVNASDLVRLLDLMIAFRLSR